MAKRITSRIYLNDGNVLREFLWFSEGDDTSLYFGSSITKLLKRGYSGSEHVPVGGGHFDYTSGRKLISDELKDKTSLHKSGIINQSVHENENEKRKRSHSIPLVQYEDIIPVASVIPMQVRKYPVTKKTIRKQDITIQLQTSNDFPLAIFFYIKKETNEDPPIISKIQSHFKAAELKKSILNNWQLCALTYSNCRNNVAWPDLEITIKAKPDEKGKINVPVFSHI